MSSTLISQVRGRLGGLRELRGGREVLLFARLASFAAAVPLLMRLPLPRLAALIARTPRGAPISTAELERIERLITLAPRVARPLVRPGCLTRGVTLFWYLRRRGLDVELRFGLEPSGCSHGHCWLCLDGEPFLEDPDPRPRFAEVYRLPVLAP